jgi:hypothetical protein
VDTRAPESRGGGAPSRAEGLLLPLVPFLLYAGANLPLLWKRDFFLYHDTFELFQLFYIGYRNVLLHGALPEWVPYGNYGMPSYVKDITGFSPFSYLTFAVGRTLGVSDAWPLFLVSLAAEVLVFAVGLHALCRVFLSRFASLLAGTAFLLTSPLWWNYGFHFRVIYLVPVASWLLVAFFRTGSASALALSGALLVLSSYGQPAYMLLMYAIYGVTLGGALAVAYRRRLHLQFDAASVVAVPLAVFFTGATAYLFVTSMRGVAFVARDRDPTTLQVPLSTFLRYGGGGVGKLVELFIGVPVLTPDVFVHVTVVALVLAVYALVRERTRDFLAVAAAFVVLLVFCFGPYSPVAYALYFLPGMAYFRHVGLMYAFPRLLLVVLAGFGADRLLARLAEAPAVAGAAPLYGSLVWLESGGFVVSVAEGRSFLRLDRSGVAVGAPKPLKAPGYDGTFGMVSRLPKDRGVLMQGTSYAEGAYHVDIAVLDLKSGKVRILVRDATRAEPLPMKGSSTRPVLARNVSSCAP